MMNLTMKQNNKQYYKFESWLRDMECVIAYHKFRLEVYGNEAEFYGLCNGAYLITPEPPTYFIEYLLKHDKCKHKKDGTTKLKLSEGELEEIYNDFKKWVKRISIIDELITELN